MRTTRYLSSTLAPLILLAAPAAMAEVDAGAHVSVDVRDRPGDDGLTLTRRGFVDAVVELREPMSRLRASGAIRAHLLQDASAIQLADESSFFRIAWAPQGWGDDEGLSATLYPLSSRALHAGFLDPIAWRREHVGHPANDVLGGKVELRRGRWSAWAGLKTAEGFDAASREPAQRPSLLAGGHFDVVEALRVEANGAWGPDLDLPVLPAPGVNTSPRSRGVSGRVTYHRGDEVRLIRDLELFGRDPYFYDQLLAPEVGTSHGSHQVSVEVTHLRQDLAVPDHLNVTRDVGAWAAAIDGRVQVGRVRLNALALLRDLSFIQRDVPGVPPFFDFPDGTEVQPELSASLGAEYAAGKRLPTPGLVIRATRPASFRGPAPLIPGTPPESLPAPRAVVVRDTNVFSILAPDQPPSPLFSVLASVRMDVLDALTVSLHASSTYDPNRVAMRMAPEGIVPSEPLPLVTWSGALLMQLRL